MSDPLRPAALIAFQVIFRVLVTGSNRCCGTKGLACKTNLWEYRPGLPSLQ